MDKIKSIEKELLQLRSELQNHKLYKEINTLDDVKIFMKSHVFAVWDFMSLLKALQINLTCVQLPWTPVKNSKTARFINEIVLEEETDVDLHGNPKSHFQMYLDAMQQVGADVKNIKVFLEKLPFQKPSEAIKSIDVIEEVKQFVQFTFDVVSTNKAHVIASSFTFGREDIIPDMFIEIVKNAEKKENKDYSKLLYYLNRHIELDENDHGPTALNMVRELCENDAEKWEDVLQIAKLSLEKRIKLWDGIYKNITSSVLTI